MTDEARLHFESARECINDAQILYSNFRFGGSVARAYYAMFHAATAVLLEKDIKRVSHKGLISAFGEFIIKPGQLDMKFHQYLREAFDLRQESDYQPIGNISQYEAQKVVERASEFIEACARILK